MRALLGGRLLSSDGGSKIKVNAAFNHLAPSFSQACSIEEEKS